MQGRASRERQFQITVMRTQAENNLDGQVEV